VVPGLSLAEISLREMIVPVSISAEEAGIDRTVRQLGDTQVNVWKDQRKLL